MELLLRIIIGGGKFMKKNNNSYINKRKVLEFLDSKGFYIVLVLCICIISGTAYIVTKRNLESYVGNNDLIKSSATVKPNYKSDTGTNTPADNTIKVSNENKLVANNNLTPKTNESIRTTSKNDSTLKITSLESPVLGDYIRNFAKDSLVYSQTLEQWTTHEGLDIAVERGTPVKAASDGIVCDVYNDYKYGITVVIDSEQGVKTVYSNLSTETMVKKGGKVKKGDVISGVGNTAVFESGEPSHLHFEVIENGKRVDPKKFLK